MPSEVRTRARVRPKNGRKFILVANSKGGSGKTTLATNLAAAYAHLGLDTTLVDCDQQQSSLTWLDARSSNLPHIHFLNGNAHIGVSQLDWALRVSPDASRVIVDISGATRGQQLYSLLQKVDDIVVPVQPSVVDIKAATEFLNEIFIAPGFKTSGKRLFVIGNRVEKRNKYFHQLNRFLQKMGANEVISLPNSYLFLRCADEGLGVVDLKQTARNKNVKNAMQKIINCLEAGND